MTVSLLPDQLTAVALLAMSLLQVIGRLHFHQLRHHAPEFERAVIALVQGVRIGEIGRANVSTPVTNVPHVCCLLHGINTLTNVPHYVLYYFVYVHQTFL